VDLFVQTADKGFRKHITILLEDRTSTTGLVPNWAEVPEACRALRRRASRMEDDYDSRKKTTVREPPRQQEVIRAKAGNGKEPESVLDAFIKGMNELKLKYAKLEGNENLETKQKHKEGEDREKPKEGESREKPKESEDRDKPKEGKTQEVSDTEEVTEVSSNLKVNNDLSEVSKSHELSLDKDMSQSQGQEEERPTQKKLEKPLMENKLKQIQEEENQGHEKLEKPQKVKELEEIQEVETQGQLKLKKPQKVKEPKQTQENKKQSQLKVEKLEREIKLTRSKKIIWKAKESKEKPQKEKRPKRLGNARRKLKKKPRRYKFEEIKVRKVLKKSRIEVRVSYMKIFQVQCTRKRERAKRKQDIIGYNEYGGQNRKEKLKKKS
jgi:hypothetical protein